MPYDPHRHHRHALRLPHYDYAQAGAYFVMICTHGRQHLFGDVVHGQVQLNDAGAMVTHWWKALPTKFAHVEVDTYVVMPDHVHGIIVIHAATEPPSLPHAALPTLMQWFKTMTTNAYIRGVKHHGWPAFCGKVWHRNYYERIIRNEAAHDAIRRYILNNPAKWTIDHEQGPA